MSETQVVVPTQADPKTTAANISKGIENKANGKTQASATPTKDQNGSTPPPVDPNAGKEKYTVDGKDIWLSPDQARAYVQKGIAFEPKVDQLNRLQKETSEFLNTLSKDPMRVLMDKRIGVNPEAVLEKLLASGAITEQAYEKVGKWYWENVVEPERLSPEEKEYRKTKKENEEFKAKESFIKEMAVKQDNQRKVDEAMNLIKANIGEAMKKSGLPDINSPLGSEMARMTADMMRVAYFQRQALTPDQAIEKVKERIKEVQRNYYDILNEDELVATLGEANAEKVKKYFLKLAKAADKSTTEHKIPSATGRPGERKTRNMDDLHDYLAKIKAEG